MENILLNAFSEHLSQLIIGFRRDQINSSLLTGRGEIKSIDLNCDILNGILRSYTPLVELESVHVTRLGFNVTSFTNIKKAPIEVIIDEIHVKIVETLKFDDDNDAAAAEDADDSGNAATAATGEAAGAAAGGNSGSNATTPAKRTTPYGLFDRIGDNIHVEINRIYTTFQPLGKFKTRRTGPWTPPALGITLRNFRYVSVDEFGEEGTPEQCWRHNEKDRRVARSRTDHHGHGHHPGHHRPHDLFIYKKLTLMCSIGLRPAVLQQQQEQQAAGTKPATKLLLRSVPVEIDIAMQKRKHDAAFLAAQSDVSLSEVEIEVDDNTVPLLAHMVAAVSHLVAKDRTFVDPLKPDGSGDGGVSGNGGGGTLVDESIEMTIDEDDVDGKDGPKGRVKAKLATASAVSAADVDDGDNSLVDEDDASSSSSSSLEEGDEEGKDGGGIDDEAGEGEDIPVAVAASTGAPSQSAQGQQIAGAAGVAGTKEKKKKFYPAYVFQSGITIHNRISLSLAVHHCTVRAWYPTSLQGGGYLQCVLKGLVTEAIWPPRPGARGGIGQVSLSYISLQERHGKALRPMMIGGQQVQSVANLLRNADGVSGGSSGGGGRDEPDMMEAPPEITFPLFEERSIRTDGYNMRDSVPSQAIGLKCTVDIHDDDMVEGKTKMSFLNEIGMDRIDITLDADAYCRALAFCLNGDEGFDERWYSGDWVDWLSPDVFVTPIPGGGGVPSLEPYLQPLPELFLDENHLISSDLFNLTSKTTNLRLRLPAPVHKDVKSSNIVISLSDMMVLVSSVLPKTILSGKISPSEDDGDPAKNTTFPNDPSDISANLSQIDALISDGFDEKDMRSSTFRVQMTMEGFSVRAIPAIPLNDAKECEDVVAPTKLSCLVCLDVKAPPTAHTRKGMGIAVHFSTLVHRLETNVDFDVIASLASTVLYHANVITECGRSMKSPSTTKREDKIDDASTAVGGGGLDRVLKSQVSQSMESGIVVFLFCIHIPELDLRLWRQDCAIKNHSGITEARMQQEPVIPVLLLARIRLKQLQVGGEAAKGLHDIDDNNVRLITKVGISAIGIELCDPTLAVALTDTGTTDEKDNDGQKAAQDVAAVHLECMAEVFTLGPVHDEDAEEECNFIRFDYDGYTESAVCAVEFASSGALHLKLGVVEQVIAHVVEALFVPTGIHHESEAYRDTAVDKTSSIFPSGSVGRFLAGLCLSEGSNTTDSVSALAPKAGPAISSVARLSSLRRLAFRLSAEQFAVSIPAAPSSKMDTSVYYILQLSNSTAIVGFFQDQTTKTTTLEGDDWGRRCSGATTDWSSHFNDHATGMHLSFASSQGLSHSEDPHGKPLVQLVPRFDVDGHYHPKSTALSMDKVNLSFEEAQAFKQLVDAITAVGRSGYEISKDVLALQATLLVESDISDEEIKDTQSHNAVQIASKEVLSSIAAVQSLISTIETDLSSRKEARRSNDEDKHEQLEKAKLMIFLKERQRVAALSLVSARVCGWIRMGSVNQSGQGIINSTTLWRYWAVVRKSLLIISDQPGGAKPIDIIPLRDVTLRSITGGNKRTELQRGFALVDTSGYQWFFSCSTGADYELWLEALSSIAKVAKYSQLQPVAEIAGTWESEEDATYTSVSHVPLEPSGIAGSTEAVTRPPVEAAVATPQRVRSFSGESALSDRRQLLKSRFTAVKDNTKSRLGDTSSKLGAAVAESQRGGRLMQRMAEAKASANAKLGEAASVVRAASDISSDPQHIGSPNGERRFGRRIPSMRTAAQPSRLSIGEPSSPMREGTDLRHSVANAEVGPKQPNLTPSETSTTTATESLISFDEDASVGDETLQVRRKLGEKMIAMKSSVKSLDGSKIQSAMKSAIKLDGQALNRLNSGSFQHPASQSVTGSDRPSLRVKSLRALPEGPRAKQDDLPQAQLRRIPGQWNVKVRAIRVEEANAYGPEGMLPEEDATRVAKTLSPDATDDNNAGANGIEPSAKSELLTRTEGQEQTRTFRWRYEISLDCIQLHHAQVLPETPQIKKLSDILHYYTQISQSIAAVRGYDEEYESQPSEVLDISAISAAACSQLAATGRILEGILELNEHVMEHEDVRSYQCEVLCAYFNAILSSPLPSDSICATIDFFNLRGTGMDIDVSDCLTSYCFNLSEPSTRRSREKTRRSDAFDSIHKLLSTCKAELAKSSRVTLMTSNLLSASTPMLGRGTVSASIPKRPNGTGSKKDVLQEAMHEALISAMTERDEAHAQLVAASVLHVHEMEQERKKIDRLTRKLVVAEKINAEANVGSSSFFLGSDEISAKDSLLKKERDMMQNTDDELLAMCRQLSSEISEKTAAALEIVRLQDSNKIEREAEKARRDEMQVQIDELKLQLANEKARGTEAHKRALGWKSSFHEAVSSGLGTSHENGFENATD